MKARTICFECLSADTSKEFCDVCGGSCAEIGLRSLFEDIGGGYPEDQPDNHAAPDELMDEMNETDPLETLMSRESTGWDDPRAWDLSQCPLTELTVHTTVSSRRFPPAESIGQSEPINIAVMPSRDDPFPIASATRLRTARGNYGRGNKHAHRDITSRSAL